MTVPTDLQIKSVETHSNAVKHIAYIFRRRLAPSPLYLCCDCVSWVFYAHLEPVEMAAGVVLAIIGGALLGANEGAVEIEIDYTQCMRVDGSGTPTRQTCAIP